MNENLAAYWQLISTAVPGVTVDVWAKRWRSEADDFEQRRFANCKLRREVSYLSDGHPFWEGIDKGWCPTHWMPLPEQPHASLRDRNTTP